MIGDVPACYSDSINIRPYNIVSLDLVRRGGTRTRVASRTPCAAMSMYEVTLMPRISRYTRMAFKTSEIIDSIKAILGQ